MNIVPLFKATHRIIGSAVLTVTPLQQFTTMINRNLHYICNKQAGPTLLQPSTPMQNLVCGLKMKTLLKRRCKSCLLMWKNDRKYIICKSRPRHNQVERKKAEYKTWIITHASQSRVREW